MFSNIAKKLGLIWHGHINAQILRPTTLLRAWWCQFAVLVECQYFFFPSVSQRACGKSERPCLLPFCQTQGIPGQSHSTTNLCHHWHILPLSWQCVTPPSVRPPSPSSSFVSLFSCFSTPIPTFSFHSFFLHILWSSSVCFIFVSCSLQFTKLFSPKTPFSHFFPHS